MIDQIIEELESAVGPDPALDSKIMDILYGPKMPTPSLYSGRDAWIVGSVETNDLSYHFEPIAFTRSFDKIREYLMPAARDWLIGANKKNAFAGLPSEPVTDYAATPELAFCILALKTRQLTAAT